MTAYIGLKHHDQTEELIGREMIQQSLTYKMIPWMPLSLSYLITF